MPVFLDEVPAVVPKVHRPDTRKWSGLFVFLLVVGCLLSFLFWTGTKEGLVFWFTALGVPFCLWGIFFGLRRIAYKTDQVWAESWNANRNALWNEEILRGQRSAWLIASGVITQSGSRTDKILSAIQSSSPIIQVQKTREGAQVRHSKLSGFEELQSTKFSEAIKTLITQIEPVLAKIPSDIICRLIADFNTPGIPDALQIASEIIQSETGRSFVLLDGNGFEALDNWLDNAWRKPSLVLSLSAEIRQAPGEGEGEAITLALMLNRKHPGIPEAVQLRRPEKYKNDSLTKTLSRALIWSQLSPEEVKGSWGTGLNFSQGGEWHSACEENKLSLNMAEEHKNIDDFIGYCGVSAPWLAVAISSLVARSGAAQIIAVETDTNDIWIAGVTPGDNTGIRQDTL
ncbi:MULTISPECIES: hypothetical protein [Enterobacter]|uniref:hypothetical protein n=1 Tax=Enterobacter TaxID=547 RepID=UPI000486BC8C|nr:MULTISPECIES: hypothetical protein [Enterobacter cloacae complex]HDT2077485.1 hypothetical protein [Enterobacter roggenkampii]HEG2000065.1 hypothetical protein [Enterobacter asburiae]MCD2460954.1 hypothetical protein [Enterobacter cloacae complex sp. 2021EL-01261]MDT9873529.1 hypothetical protein [Enterobacter cloacae]HDT2097900.1 hypothetical protein [Enterobacter roggenkampii]